MRSFLKLLVPGLLLAAAPASAAIYSASFSGTATTTTGTAISAGSTVAGSFSYSSDAGKFLSFNIGGYSLSGTSTASVTTVPSGAVNPFEAIYRASSSAAQTGGNTNTAFSLDLLSFNTFTGSDPFAILASPGSLETQANSFDGSFSQFEYYMGSADGTGVTDLIVALNPTSLTSSSVPEPATLALLGLPLLALTLRRRA